MSLKTADLNLKTLKSIYEKEERYLPKVLSSLFVKLITRFHSIRTYVETTIIQNQQLIFANFQKRLEQNLDI
jgi:hypothetical protein